MALSLNLAEAVRPPAQRGPSQESWLSPGYSFTTNVGIGIAGTFYTNGFDHSALGGSVIGSVAGGAVGELAPTVLRPILGPSAGFISEVGGAYVSEVASDATEKAINKTEDKK